MKRGTLTAPLAALASVAAALSCCLPFGYLLAAAGLAGAGSLLEAGRPYLYVPSGLLLVVGFARTYLGKECRARRTRTGVVLLWTATAVVLALLVLPRWVGALLPRYTPAGQPPLATLSLPEFQKQFNDAAGRARIVTLLSPT